MEKLPVFAPWLKYSLTFFLCIFITFYWIHRGPANLLWFSDLALIAAVLSLWSEKSLPASALATGVLFFEMGWIFDFLSRLLTGQHLFGLNATEYMFSGSLPLVIQVLSLLLHLLLPVSLLYILYKLGYDRRGWLVQTILAWIILPACYFFTDVEKNINWVFGIGGHQNWVSEPVYLIAGMLILPLLIYLPTHLLLKRYF
ncbi:hypothetical protein [Kaarinaea lacus]